MFLLVLISLLIYNDRSKHIDDDYHFVCEMVGKGGFMFHHVPTQSQVADIFTEWQSIVPA